jgi:acyl-coenzyme A thioesterase PaaI-like protein
MTVDLDVVDDLRDRYRRCFGCGRENPIGLGLDGFAVTDIDGTSWVTSSFTPRPDYAGFADTLHGGVVATALDEASAWAAMVTEGVLVFTARLDIRYRRAASTATTLHMRGRVVERRGRRLTIEAAMVDAGRIAAESEGLFVVAEEHTAALTQ